MMSSSKQKPRNSIKVWLLQLSPLYRYVVLGNSMSPTLPTGQTVLVNRLSYVFKKPKKGDIVAVRDPRDKKVLIKRIAKKVGDKYEVLGDNKKQSTDSRVFGLIAKHAIIGKVFI